MVARNALVNRRDALKVRMNARGEEEIKQYERGKT
jgi:hypothetical protein